MTISTDELKRALETLKSITPADADARAFLRTVDADGATLVLSGNREGLVAVAAHLLSLAHHQTPNSHVHLDASSPLDACDRALVLRFEPAPWDPPTSDLE